MPIKRIWVALLLFVSGFMVAQAQPFEFRGRELVLYRWNDRVSITSMAYPPAIRFSSGRVKVVAGDSVYIGAIRGSRFEVESVFVLGDEGEPIGSGVSEDVEAPGICNERALCLPVAVDLLVVYSNQVDSAYAGIDVEVGDAVDEMNMALELSGANHRVRLVAVEGVDYDESGSGGTDLGALKLGHAGNALELREWYQADVVTLVIRSGACGLAYVQSDAVNMQEGLAFNVVGRNCMVSHLSLAHEVGHSMGLMHDWYTTQTQQPCPWAKGYVNEAVMTDSLRLLERWVTIMAYRRPCTLYGTGPCYRTWYYSNPYLNIQGWPAGVEIGLERPADAVNVLNRSMCVVSEFRGEALALFSEEIYTVSSAEVYPNPFHGVLNVDSDEEVLLYDLLGRLVFRADRVEGPIQTHLLPPGVYFLRSGTIHQAVIKR